MSLDYQLTKIENYDEVCIQHFNDESWDLKLVTSHLIFMMLFIEMSGITRDNVGEVWARLNLMYGLGASTHINGDGSNVRATLQEVLDHIGLTTNVPSRTRHQWLSRKGGQVQGYMDDHYRIPMRELVRSGRVSISCTDASSSAV